VITWVQVIPIALIVLSAGSSVANLVAGDLSRAVYWAAAATLNYSVTFPLPSLPWAR